MGKKKNKNSSEVPRCQSLVIPLCILKSSHEVKNKRSQESVSQQRRRITVTVRRVNSLQITPLSPPPQPLFKPISLLLLPPSLPPSLVSKHDTTQERWSVGAISRAKFGGAAAVVAAGPFHTLILRRMCNYTAAGGRCGFSRDQKKKKKGFNEHVDEELSWIHRCEWEHRESKTEESLLALREDDSQR